MVDFIPLILLGIWVVLACWGKIRACDEGGRGYWAVNPQKGSLYGEKRK